MLSLLTELNNRPTSTCMVSDVCQNMETFVIKTKRKLKDLGKVSHKDKDEQFRKKIKVEKTVDSVLADPAADDSDSDTDCDSSDGNLEFADIKTLAKPACVKWRKISGENLDCDYCILYNQEKVRELFQKCESEIEYNTGKLSQVRVFGKWHNIPRKQVNILSHCYKGTADNLLPGGD